mmetsp:Transcript_376/g.445  ORF Transcript_376/g.445 Transcript_376/m.445 type:complete len:480 (+) Transcript_376:210-1649(+)
MSAPGSSEQVANQTENDGAVDASVFEYSPRSERNAIALYSNPLNKDTANNIRKITKTLSFRSTASGTEGLEASERRPLLETIVGDEEGESSAVPAKSTFKQATLNGINILAGVGILSLPFAFRQSGWLLGLCLLIYLCMVTNYTGKLIGRCMSLDSRICTYSDLGTFAFGRAGRWTITAVFCIELLAALSMFIALMGDHLVALFPSVSRNLWCVFSTVAVLPTCMTDRLSLLSNLSIIGVFTTVFLFFVLAEVAITSPKIDISTKDFHAIGSLSTAAIPYSLGLQMVGFAGHAVFPSIYDSLENKQDFPKVIDVVYVVTAIIYISMAFFGYLCFKEQTKEEVTLNLYDVAPESLLVKSTVVLIIINPLTKFSLGVNPLAKIAETTYPSNSTIGFVFLRTILCAIPCLLAIALPSFAVICAFVGAFCSFIVSGIFPIMCYVKLFGHSISRPWYAFNLLVIIVNSIFCVMGTGAVFVAPKA